MYHFYFTFLTNLEALPPVPHLWLVLVHEAFHAGEEAVLQSKVVFTLCQQLRWNKIHNLKYHSKRAATLADWIGIAFIQIRNSFDILNFAFLHSVDLQVTKHLISLSASNNWTCCQYSQTTPYGHLSVADSSLGPDKMAMGTKSQPQRANSYKCTLSTLDKAVIFVTVYCLWFQIKLINCSIMHIHTLHQ